MDLGDVQIEVSDLISAISNIQEAMLFPKKVSNLRISNKNDFAQFFTANKCFSYLTKQLYSISEF